MHRREMLKTAGAAAISLTAFPFGWVSAADNKKQKILFFTRSVGFIHPEVDRKQTDGKLARAEKVLIEWSDKAGFEVVCSQDPAVFDGDLNQYDALAFYTTGIVMSLDQKKKLLDAVTAGKPFIGIHSATDTFHSARGTSEIDPYVAMIGAEFVRHDMQQKAKNRVVDAKFPGMEGLGESIELMEEWYTCRNFAKDMHVILVQETEGMRGSSYQRPPFPATWAKMYGKGRVFYTSMGHREDIWKNKNFQQILLGGIAWALGNVKAEIPANFEQVTPDGNKLTNSSPAPAGR